MSPLALNLMTAGIGVFLLLFLAFSYRKPMWAGMFVLATLPSYLVRFQIGSIPFTLLEGMIWAFALGALASGALGLKLRRQGRPVDRKNLPFVILVTLFLAAGLVSVFAAPETNAALGILKSYVVEAALFTLVFLLVWRRHVGAQNSVPLHGLLYTLGTTTLLVSFYAIFQKLTGFGIPNAFWQAEETRRATSIFEYPNALGLYLGPIAVLYWGAFLAALKKRRPRPATLAFVVFFASLLAILFAVSEGALFGVAAGMFVVVILALPKHKKPGTVGTRHGVFLLAVIIAAVFLAVPPTRHYFVEKVSLNDFSGGVRIAMWSETWEMLQDRPLLGAGLAGYQERVAPYHQDPLVEVYLYPHNIFLNFWSEMGLLGLVCVVGLFILFFLRTRNPILLGLMIQILVHGLVDAPFFKNDLAIIFLMVLFAGITQYGVSLDNLGENGYSGSTKRPI